MTMEPTPRLMKSHRGEAHLQWKKLFENHRNLQRFLSGTIIWICYHFFSLFSFHRQGFSYRIINIHPLNARRE